MTEIKPIDAQTLLRADRVDGEVDGKVDLANQQAREVLEEGGVRPDQLRSLDQLDTTRDHQLDLGKVDNNQLATAAGALRRAVRGAVQAQRGQPSQLPPEVNAFRMRPPLVRLQLLAAGASSVRYQTTASREALQAVLDLPPGTEVPPQLAQRIRDRFLADIQSAETAGSELAVMEDVLAGLRGESFDAQTWLFDVAGALGQQPPGDDPRYPPMFRSESAAGYVGRLWGDLTIRGVSSEAVAAWRPGDPPVRGDGLDPKQELELLARLRPFLDQGDGSHAYALAAGFRGSARSPFSRVANPLLQRSIEEHYVATDDFWRGELAEARESNPELTPRQFIESLTGEDRDLFFGRLDDAPGLAQALTDTDSPLFQYALGLERIMPSMGSSGHSVMPGSLYDVGHAGLLDRAEAALEAGDTSTARTLTDILSDFRPYGDDGVRLANLLGRLGDGPGGDRVALTLGGLSGLDNGQAQAELDALLGEDDPTGEVADALSNWWAGWELRDYGSGRSSRELFPRSDTDEAAVVDLLVKHADSPVARDSAARILQRVAEAGRRDTLEPAEVENLLHLADAFPSTQNLAALSGMRHRVHDAAVEQKIDRRIDATFELPEVRAQLLGAKTTGKIPAQLDLALDDLAVAAGSYNSRSATAMLNRIVAESLRLGTQRDLRPVSERLVETAGPPYSFASRDGDCIYQDGRGYVADLFGEIARMKKAGLSDADIGWVLQGSSGALDRSDSVAPLGSTGSWSVDRRDIELRNTISGIDREIALSAANHERFSMLPDTASLEHFRDQHADELDELRVGQGWLGRTFEHVRALHALDGGETLARVRAWAEANHADVPRALEQLATLSASPGGAAAVTNLARLAGDDPSLAEHVDLIAATALAAPAPRMQRLLAGARTPAELRQSFTDGANQLVRDLVDGSVQVRDVAGLFEGAPMLGSRLAAFAGGPMFNPQGGLRGATAETVTVLGNVVERHPSRAVREAAARNVLDSGVELPNDVRQQLVDHAAVAHSAALREEILALLPESPVDQEHLASVGKRYRALVAEHLRNPEEGSDWHRLAELLKARAMSQDPDWQSHINTETLSEKLDEHLNTTMADTLEEVRQQAIREALPADLGARQADYLMSEAFEQRLQLMSPNRRQWLINHELSKLNGVAPEREAAVRDHLAGRAVHTNAVRGFLSLRGSPEEQADYLNRAIRSVTDGTKIGAGVTKKIANALNKLNPDVPNGQVAGKIIDGLTELQRAAQRAGKLEDATNARRAIELVRKLNERGQVSTVLAGASLLGVVARGVPQNTEQWFASSGAVLSTIGDASQIGKLFRLSEATKLGKVLGAAGWLGPVGDLACGVADGIAAVEDFQQGDTVGGIAKSTSALAGGGAAVGGTMILVGATGVGTIVLLTATGVGLLAWGADELFGESEEESFLRNLGVWEDDYQPPPK